MTDGAQRVHGLSTFAEAVSTCASVPELVAGTAQAALAVVDGDSVSVCRFERPHGRIRVLHNAGLLAPWEEPWPEDETYHLSDYPQVMTTVGGLRRWWTGAVDDPSTAEADRDLLRRLGKRRAASFQILVGDTIWGDVYLTRAGERGFDDEDVASGLTLTGLLSAGLSRLELLTEMSRLAYSDPMTGLANRRAADRWLEDRLGADEPFPPVSLVLCDINGLKRVNDRLGHAAGDGLIRLVGTHLVSLAGELSDAMVSRIGGDEFVVLLDGVDQQQVETVVSRLAAIELPHGSGLAVGAATTTRRPAGAASTKTAARALMRLADAAQYRHKQSHRLSTDALSPDAVPISVLLPSGESDLADRVLAELASGSDQSVLHRLAVVGGALARAFDAASWWVSRQDGNVLVDVTGRPRQRWSAGLVPIDITAGQEFDPAAYPATQAALDGGGYFASLTEGETAERALVARMGYVSALAAGERASDGTGWLVELFGDPQTSSGLFVGLPLLRALVHLGVRAAER